MASDDGWFRRLGAHEEEVEDEEEEVEDALPCLEPNRSWGSPSPAAAHEPRVILAEPTDDDDDDEDDAVWAVDITGCAAPGA
jgi:hypothetical protein